MSTRIQVSEETRSALNQYASAMKRRSGKRVTFDEVIRELLDEASRRQLA